MDIFLSDYPGLLDNLRRAHKDGESDTLMRAAHSLKGMLKNFQADSAAEIAFDLEKKGREDTFDGVPKAIENLAAKVTQLDQTLRAILELNA